MIKYYQEMRKVNRLSKCFIHRKYNLLEHQYMVAMLFKYFASKEDIAYGMSEFMVVLHHDIVETVSMDLSWDVKNYSNRTKEAWGIIEDEVVKSHPKLASYTDRNIKEGLTPLQYGLFKACDVLDLLIFVKEEQELGNKDKYIMEVESNCYKIISNLPFRFESIEKFIEKNYGS